MKTLLDRCNPLYTTDYKFRDVYMIATAAEDGESVFEKAYNGLQGWVDCFEKAELKELVIEKDCYCLFNLPGTYESGRV